jgi:hypothetical protein
VNDAVYDKGGYNKWAETNKLIVLYPQTEPIGTLPLGDNPLGCWDWWGLSDALPGNREFARKTGYQISAVKKMLERLKQGPTLGGSPVSTFGKPQHLSATDSSSTYMALIWQPNSAAKSFNIYRSRTKSGAYTKIGTVSGASFGDKNLTPNSTYYYKVSAVDSSNQESAKTGPVHKKTGSKPPGCDPYFGDNITLSVEGRAFTIDTISTWAVTVGVQPHYLGDYSYDVFSQLTKDDNVPWPSYDDRYCPWAFCDAVPAGGVMEEAKRLDAIPSLFHATFAAFCVIGTMRSLSEAPPSLKVRKSANAPLESGIVRAWPAVTFGRPQILDFDW